MKAPEMPAAKVRIADPAARLRAAGLSRGTNQSGVRLYNERLVLSLVRRHGNLPKAEIARLTGLSAQTITVIVRQLEIDGLVSRQDRQRGRIGQPSVPFGLNPHGALFLGLKIGRRSSDLVLMDFLGGVRRALRETHLYPTPSGTLEFTARSIARLTEGLTRRERSRISGLGIAMPFELWNWEEEIGAPRRVLDRWRAFDLQREIPRIFRRPVFFCDDASAACGAELTFGNHGHQHDFLYFFIGSFIGGGVVLGGDLFLGRTGNAGALGSMPVATAKRTGGRGTQQLMRSASIYVLEQKLAAVGEDPSMLWRSPDDWSGLADAILDEWIEEVADSLSYAILAAIAVIDFAAVIVDGAFPVSVRAGIVARTAEKTARLDHRGLSPVAIIEGSVGSGARAIGGACLPLLANFGRDREVLFKETA